MKSYPVNKVLDAGRLAAAELVRINVNSPAALNGLSTWATNQLTNAHTFIQNQGG